MLVLTFVLSFAASLALRETDETLSTCSDNQTSLSSGHVAFYIVLYGQC